MKNDMTLEEMKLEISADKDVRVFIESLQHWYDEKREKGEVTNKSLSESAGIDASFLSRIINGRAGNPNLKTIAKIFRAMDLKVCPNVVELSSLENARANFSASQVYDDALSEWILSAHRESYRLHSDRGNLVALGEVKHVRFVLANEHSRKENHENKSDQERRSDGRSSIVHEAISGNHRHVD